MAARKNLMHSELVRERIKASALVNRLTQFIEGKISMEPHQVTAALGLLRKVVPDLQAVELSGEVKAKHVVMAEPLTEDEWAKTYGGEQHLNS